MELIVLLALPVLAGLLCLATDSARAAECPWKLSAILLVAAMVILLGFWLPGPLYQLIQQSARIIGGGS